MSAEICRDRDNLYFYLRLYLRVVFYAHRNPRRLYARHIVCGAYAGIVHGTAVNRRIQRRHDGRDAIFAWLGGRSLRVDSVDASNPNGVVV